MLLKRTVTSAVSVGRTCFLMRPYQRPSRGVGVIRNYKTEDNARQEVQKGSVPKFPFSRPRGAEPAELFAELRKNNPVSKVQLWDGSQVWLVVRHKDVCDVLSDDRFSKVRTRKGFPEYSAGGRAAATAGKPTFVDMDPPEHTKQRSMVEPVFTPQAVETLRPFIQLTVDERIQRMKTGTSKPVDLVQAFAMPVPTKTMLHMLGIPLEDMDMLLRNNAVRTSASATSKEAAAASQELTLYLDKLVGDEGAVRIAQACGMA